MKRYMDLPKNRIGGWNFSFFRIMGIFLICLALSGCQSDIGEEPWESGEQPEQEVSGEFFQKSVEYGSSTMGLFFQEGAIGKIRTIVSEEDSVHMAADGAKVYYQLENSDLDSGENLLDQDVVCYDASTEETSVIVSGKELQKALKDNRLPTRSSGYLEEFHVDRDHLYMTVSEEVEDERIVSCRFLKISLSGAHTVTYEKGLSDWLEDTVEGSLLTDCLYGFVQNCFVCEDRSEEPFRRYAWDLGKQEEIPVDKGSVLEDYLQEISPDQDAGVGEDVPEKDVEIGEELLEKQLHVILAQEKQWKYDYREKDDWVYEGAENYFYMISDLDQNGRVEIVCQTYQGNAGIPISDYYEVNEGMDGLDHITWESDTEDSNHMDFGEWSAVYYEEETAAYHYALADWERGSAVDHSDVELDVVLQDGRLKSDRYCSLEMVGDRNDEPARKNQKTENHRLGWKYHFYDKEGRKISAEDYFDLYYRDHFRSMTQRTARFSWFQTIDEEAYERDVEVKKISREEIYGKMKASYQAFGFTGKGNTVAEQIQLLAECTEQWTPWKRERTDLEPEQYSFLVADLDGNGRLELIVSFCGGSGNVSNNHYYEVNYAGDALVDITPEVEHETDWLGGSLDYREPLVAVYEDYTDKKPVIHYSVSDSIWGGAGNGEYISQDVYLKDQELHVTDFAAKVFRKGKSSFYRIEDGVREKITKKQYRRLQKKHFEDLGEEVYPYDDGKIFYWFTLSDKMSEEELVQALENGFMNWFYNGDRLKNPC